MYISSTLFLLISAVAARSFVHHDDVGKHKRTVTPDNTCGGSNGYTCDPSNSYGGPCCSAAGYCGKTDAYCGTGCQSAFGTCGSPSSAQPSASAPSQSSSPPPSTSSAGTSPTKEGCVWVVDGSGSFTQSLTIDFSVSTTLPSTLSVSTDSIPSTPDTQLYTTGNVVVQDGTLQLKVPGGQTASPILGAEVYTSEDDILYASVRTFMQVSTVAGTVSSPFFYKSDNQEADIEVLTGGTFKGVHYTNQKANSAAAQTTKNFTLTPDLTTGFHEYRLDWLPDRTDFYLDGVLQASFSENVPTVAGKWLWNNWSSGDPEWSAGPPSADNILLISKIEMYYNTTSPATC
ncbi:concanavalin A-like lectin/glucanase domain-containing protein [Usnea florida]